MKGARQGFDDALAANLRVFPACFDLEAGNAVCCLPGTSAETLSGALDALVADGRAVRIHPGRWRCTSLPDPSHALASRHARYFDSLGMVARGFMGGPSEQIWLERLELELPNLRQAMEWGLSNGNPELSLRIAVDCFSLWYKRGHLLEGSGWLRRALRDTPAQRTRLRLEGSNAAGTLAGALGDIIDGRALLMEALECAWEMGDRAAEAAVISNLGINFRDEGDLDEARKALSNAVLLWRDRLETTHLANSLTNLAAVLISLGRPLDAEPLLTEAQQVYVDVHDAWSRAMIGTTLAELELMRGLPLQARERAVDSLRMFGKLGDRRGAAQCLALLARVEARALRHDRAAVLLGATESARAATHTQVPLADLGALISTVEQVRGTLGERGYDFAWDRGFGMSPEGAADFAASATPDADEDLE